MEVLELVSARLSNAAIVERLVVSEHTVKNHMKSIVYKPRGMTPYGWRKQHEQRTAPQPIYSDSCSVTKQESPVSSDLRVRSWRLTAPGKTVGAPCVPT